jgi:REP element-mobilizing transposase RayT
MSDEKFKGKYRIPTARAKWYCYNGGCYFITICTMNREQYLGEIFDGKMYLSDIGRFLNEQILTTPQKRTDMNLEIPVYVIMPNHLHLIVSIGRNVYNSTALQPAKFEPQTKNLASVIRGIKSAVSSYAQKNNILFAWQTRYHDHIIRDAEEMEKITEYIENNVINWREDCFYFSPVKTTPQY